MSLSIAWMWLPFWKAVSQISIWLVKKAAFTIHYSLICLVRQKCRWKGNWFDRRVEALKCGWHPPDAGELALLLISIDPFLLRLEIIFKVFIMVQSLNWSLCTSTKKSRKIRVFFTIFWANDFSHFLTLVKSKVSDTYTLLTLGKAMCSFTWKNKNVSLIREDSLILTKRKELNEISYVLWFIE